MKARERGRHLERRACLASADYIDDLYSNRARRVPFELLGSQQGGAQMVQAALDETASRWRRRVTGPQTAGSDRAAFPPINRSTQ
jgi:hypothetical protein